MSNKGLKIAVGITLLIGATAAVFKNAPILSKLKNFVDNISIKPMFDRVHGITKSGALRIYLNLGIKNFTGFDLEIKNLFPIVHASTDSGKTWSEVADSPNRVDSIKILDGRTATGKIAVDVKPSAISSFGASNVQYKLISTFDFQDVQYKVESIMDLTPARNNVVAALQQLFKGGNSSLINKLKSAIGFKGVDYSLNSAALSLL